MQRHRVPLVGAGMCVVMALGCVISDNPWFTKKDVTFDPGLVGVWAAQGEKEKIAFVKSGEDGYIIRNPDSKDPKDEMAVHLVSIGGAKYLDVLMKGKEDGKERSGHLLIRAELKGDSLTITHCNAEWLAKAIEGKTVEVRGTVERKKGEGEPEVHLTGPTDELQALLAKHADDLFKGGQTLKYERKK